MIELYLLEVVIVRLYHPSHLSIDMMASTTTSVALFSLVLVRGSTPNVKCKKRGPTRSEFMTAGRTVVHYVQREEKVLTQCYLSPKTVRPQQ